MPPVVMPGPALRSCDCVGRQTTKPTLYLFFCWDSRHVWSPTLGTSTGPSPSSLDKRKRLFACPVAVGPGTAPARQCRARTVCKASRTTLSRCSPAQFLLLALYNTSLARRTKPNSELLQVLKTAAVALRIACTVGSGAVPGGSRRVSYSSSLPLPPPRGQPCPTQTIWSTPCMELVAARLGWTTSTPPARAAVASPTSSLPDARPAK